MLVPRAKLPSNASTPFERDLVRVLTELFSRYEQAINQLAGGKLSGWKATSATAPTMPSSPGDTVRNENPTVMGSPGSQYIIDGWRYGDDGLWHEITHLTDG